METANARPRNVERARKCLELIRDIADRGALSGNPDQVSYALQELSQVLLERADGNDRVFEPISVERIGDLTHLQEELLFVDGCSRDMFRPH